MFLCHQVLTFFCLGHLISLNVLKNSGVAHSLGFSFSLLFLCNTCKCEFVSENLSKNLDLQFQIVIFCC
ncbi:hypothetical protein VNO80_24694 [Phaseolus coccineus]|uniref:Uncharacterized protein n=1 Tax=Phaseolus coccineus TaxID=3886 RepID=A0AAN9LSV7_PHACN